MWDKVNKFTRQRACLFYLLIVLGLVLHGCSSGSKEKNSPVGVLQEYVSRSFSIKDHSEKSKLAELATGEVKAAIERLDPEKFQEEFVETDRDFVSLKIKDERGLGKDRYSVTYELTYVHKLKDSSDKVTNKKHAVFVKENGKWLVSEVQNLKTYIEHENDFSF